MIPRLRPHPDCSWPHPNTGHEAIERIGGPLDLDDKGPFTITGADFFALRKIVGAYDHLLRHPVGTEATIRTLRALRREVSKADASTSGDDHE